MNEQSTPRALAAVDIGTNSVHLVVARPMPGGLPEILAREKMPVRLGSGFRDMKTLDSDAIDRAIGALQRFRQIAEAHDAEVVAVATSAVREAEDRDLFLRRARNEAGIDVEVISGVEEARLIHLGALGAVPMADRRHLVIDIGGGSTELVIGEGTRPLLTRSLKLGHVRLTNRFFPGGVISDGAVKACRRHVRSFLAPVSAEIEALGHSIAVGCSGTIENLARMAALREGTEVRSINNLRLTKAGLDAVVSDIVSRHTPDSRNNLAGLDDHRADVIVAGAVLLRQLFMSLDINEMSVSSHALREGVVLDRLARRRDTHDALHHLSNIRRASVLSVAARYEEDIVHAEHATNLALQLFAQPYDLHGLADNDIDVLEAAGLLHNVGRFVAHASHHKHSYYLIRNSEHLLGFTDHEIELIAQVARYHRKSHPKDKHPAFAALSATDRHRVRVLAGMLRVSIGLDRTYRRVFSGLGASHSPEALTIRLFTDPDADVELELFTAKDRRSLLVEALGRRVEFEVVGDTDESAANETPDR